MTRIRFACELPRFGFLAVLAALCLLGTSASRADHFATSETVSIDEGFMFIDGRYVGWPSELRVQDDRLFVNDNEVVIRDYDFSFALESQKSQRSDSLRRRPRGREHGFGGPAVQGRPTRQRIEQARSAASFLAFELRCQNVVVLNQGEPSVRLPYQDGGEELIRLLGGDKRASFAGSALLVEQLTAQGGDISQYRSWINAFEPSPDFARRAGVVSQYVQEVIRGNESISTQFRYREKLAYPMTVVGMVLVVLAFGHLLNHRPLPSTDSTFDTFGIEQERVVRRSLIFVFALSSMDLIWTVLASQAGTMNELNPLGSQLIHHPLALFAAKLGVTSFSVGLLFLLRRQPLAQQASWWSCLLLTLLTARWLTFQSMFVA